MKAPEEIFVLDGAEGVALTWRLETCAVISRFGCLAPGNRWVTGVLYKGVTSPCWPASMIQLEDPEPGRHLCRVRSAILGVAQVADPEAFWPLVQAMSSEGNFPWLFALKEHLCLRPDFSELETELESAIQIAVRTCAKGT